MIDELVGQMVVLDLRSPFVCLGRLHGVGELYFDIRNADFHDLRDTETSRENYVAASRLSGIKRNRKKVLVLRSEVVAVSNFDDVVEG